MVERGERKSIFSACLAKPDQERIMEKILRIME
jgi:hypothetical protein